MMGYPPFGWPPPPSGDGLPLPIWTSCLPGGVGHPFGHKGLDILSAWVAERVGRHQPFGGCGGVEGKHNHPSTPQTGPHTSRPSSMSHLSGGLKNLAGRGTKNLTGFRCRGNDFYMHVLTTRGCY